MNKMNTIHKFHNTADALIHCIQQKNPTFHPPCSAGCFWCCYEPAYASVHEVQHMLEGLTAEQREQVNGALDNWVARAGPLLDTERPDANEYRKLHAPCPLLDATGQCMAYERRPFSCRTFFAMSDPHRCACLHERRHQQYACFNPSLFAESMIQMVLELGGTELDHIGALLWEQLRGSRMETASREKHVLETECAPALQPERSTPESTTTPTPCGAGQQSIP